MASEFHFGRAPESGAAPATLKKARRFRLAVLGDFSARASRGEREAGDALAARKPLRVEADNLDDLLARLSPRLRLILPGVGVAELEFSSFEDFHPDTLYGKLEIFSQLSGLRQRLKTPATFAKAAEMLRAIGLTPPPEAPAAPVVSRGSVIDPDAADLASLLGSLDGAAAPAPEPSDIKASFRAFMRNLVAPHVTAAKNPQQDQWVAVADEAIGAMMREVLHHPDFQALESLWRSLEFLATRLETDEETQIVLFDLSAEEFAADLAAGEPEATALHQLLVEQPAQDQRAGPFSAVVANYILDQTPAQAELLGRMAQVAARAQAPFLASVSLQTLDRPADDLPEAARDAWAALRAKSEAAYLALACPRFLLRLPYGRKTEPIESFRFEEAVPPQNPRGLLWANPAVAVGLLLGQTYRQQGDAMRPGALSNIDEMPYYTYTDADGDSAALPCTERLLSASALEAIAAKGFLPLASLKNSPEVRVGMFRAVGGSGVLAGWWAPAPISSDSQAPASVADAGPAAGIDPVEATLAAAAGAEAALTAEAAVPVTPAGDPELDALLSSLDTNTPPAATANAGTEAAAGDPELDALLASMSSDAPAPPAAAAPPEMDPDLAKLLEGLDT